MSTGTARRILDSSNSRDKSLTVGCVYCSEDKKVHSKHDEGAQIPQWTLRELVHQRILMREYVSSLTKKKVDMRDKRETVVVVYSYACFVLMQMLEYMLHSQH